MSLFAQVIIDISHEKVDRPFTYRIPEELRGSAGPGTIVSVPFGRGDRLREGYIVELTDEGPEGVKIKDIDHIVTVPADSAKQTAAVQIRLAAWMKQQYGSTMAAALRTVMTSGRRGSGKERKEAELMVSPEEAAQAAEDFDRRHQVARARLLRALLLAPRQSLTLLTTKLHVTSQTARSLERSGYIRISTVSSFRNPVVLQQEEEKEKILTPAQADVVKGVLEDFDRGIPKTHLIHGVTGSGKTEVYIRIIEEIIARGYQAIMLIPEISLTYQTLLRFYSRFGDRVSVVNSTLSEAEKRDQFERAARRGIDVIIGPRSALFTPFPRPGVVIIDEEHEGTYKNEQMPRYHAREAAIRLMREYGGAVVLGSATPSVDAYYRAMTGEFRLFTLPERAAGSSMAEVETVDLREELAKGNRSMFSRSLAEKIEDRLEKKEQVMLFLNRRGLSGFVACRSCGEAVKCPHCDVSLSLHGRGRLVCHYCGYEQPMVKTCPSCGSPYVSGFRAGTEQVEKALREQYPKAKILRMDADTTGRKGDYERILSAFASEEADILIGTQMIVKGHDFPKVTLVGILLADLSLYGSDYAASERTFALLTQAAGRAGRADRPGEVVIQTYQPDNYAVVYAARQDYRGFYEKEIRYRKMLHYPPVYHMMSVQFSSESEDLALYAAGECRRIISERIPGVSVIGPAAAPLSRLRDQYRFVLYVKEEKYDTLIQCKNLAEQAFLQGFGEQRTPEVFIQFDFT